ncbi:MAG TPA: DNA polymerase Y family protein [Hyphomicrobiaceae bacterium]|jgi:protein ImuB
MARIVSVWLKAWPIARLLRAQACAGPSDAFGHQIDPDRPLVLVAPGKGGPRIVALNRTAQQVGLAVGDLLSNARSKVLGLQAHDADPAADAAALHRLALWAMRYAPIVAPWAAPWGEASGADGLFIDITGAAHLFGGEARLLADLDRRLRGFGLVPRLAIAGTPGAAWALARHGDPVGSTAGLILAPGAEADALRPLPLAALRLPEATLSLLRRLGLRRIGDVMDAPRAPLAARFEALLLRLDQALGLAPEPLVPAVPPPVYRAQAMFVEPIVSREHVLEAATRLLDSLAADLARDAVGARVLRLMLFQVDGRVQAVEIGLAVSSRDARHIARLIALRLERVADSLDADFGFEAAAVHVLVAEPLTDHQPGLTMGEALAPPDALAQLIDRLQQRLGPAAVRQLRPHRSHLPERAVVGGVRPLASDLSPSLKRDGEGSDPVSASGERESAQRLWRGSTPAAPRPLLLLPRPEPAEVVALIPEGPPRQFRWRGVRHQVAHAQGPERIAPEWWRLETGSDPSLLSLGGSSAAETRGLTPFPAERDYYVVEDSAGRRFWLYRAGRYGHDAAPPQWFIQGLFG